MCRCQIIPKSVLERLANDTSLTQAQRTSFADTATLDEHFREIRALTTTSSGFAATAFSRGVAVAPTPAVTVYDCSHGTSLPGTLVSSPGSSGDPTAKAVYTETTSLAKFYKQVFGRNSIDDLGMTLQSSIHYGVSYNNAFWNGTQMTYGDGDGNIFVDFSKSNDVIGHELTHGITQHTLQLNYTNQPGGLNESLSDVFGSMFRQWEASQNVTQADWLIGAGIMGPGAIARGFKCLRDMANPGGAHCLSPQPAHFSKYQNGMDPHESSGIPNLAFCKAAVAYGGQSWKVVGQVWYKVLTTSGPKPNMSMKAFAKATRVVAKSAFSGDSRLIAAIDSAWKAVGL